LLTGVMCSSAAIPWSRQEYTQLLEQERFRLCHHFRQHRNRNHHPELPTGRCWYVNFDLLHT